MAETDAAKICDRLNAAWYAANPDQLESDLARSLEPEDIESRS